MINKSINSIFSSKMGLIYKMILFLLILAVVVGIIGFAIVAPVSKDLRAGITELGLGQKFGKYFVASITGEDVEAASEAFVEAVNKIDDVMSTWTGAVVGSVITIVILALIFSIFYFMSHYTISDIVKNFMSSNSDYGFGANYIANAKKSILFSVYYTLYSVVINAVGFSIAVALGILISKWISILGTFVTILLALATLALRRSLTPFWIPAMVILELNANQAFVKNFEQLKGRFWKTFGAYFMIFLVFTILFIVSSIVTVGVAGLFIFPAMWLYMQIRDMVSFYYINNMKYYIDEQTVVDPKKLYRDAILEEENFKL